MKPELSHSFTRLRHAYALATLLAFTTSAIESAGAARAPADGARDETPAATADCHAMLTDGMAPDHLIAGWWTANGVFTSNSSLKAPDQAVRSDARPKHPPVSRVQLAIAGYAPFDPQVTPEPPTRLFGTSLAPIRRPGVPPPWTWVSLTWKF